jgi:Zn-dependent protease with chaperone function
LASTVKGTGNLVIRRSHRDALYLQRRKLMLLRLLGWPTLFIEIGAVCLCLRLLIDRPDLWLWYIGSLAVVWAVFHGFPHLFWRWAIPTEAVLKASGDQWRIGRYSEAELRALLNEATMNLPPRLRRIRVRIVKERSTAAFTKLSVLWPDWGRPKAISITSGSLYYLEPDELKAAVLHEIGHHLRENRINAPGGWLLTDVALHAVVFYFMAPTEESGLAVGLFFLLRTLTALVLAAIVGKAHLAIEHLCDVFAARHLGKAPVINALLKMGEEDELTEVVLVWAAKELVDFPGITDEELMLAFSETRPFGRIFHENLVRHAGEVVKKVREYVKAPSGKKKRTRRVNRQLQAFIEARRRRLRRRIRWRQFDQDGDGSLTAGEIAELCRALRDHPDHALVRSRWEDEPTTHPPCRQRVFLLCELGPSGSQPSPSEERTD